MSSRDRAQVYGEVVGAYDGVRPGYPDALVDAVLSYAGTPRRTVEVGAGTGKATAVFAARGLPIRCIEPDPRMATVLRQQVATYPLVEVEVSRFEDWQPPAGGVDLLFCAQAWHWVDSATRWRQAQASLAPGGAVAIFAHSYHVVDPEIESAIWELHTRLRPDTSVMAPPGGIDPDQMWFSAELAASGLFTDVRSELFRRVVSYPTARYLALVQTFSACRMLAPDQRREMHDAVGQVLDNHGGAVEIDLATVLALGRRPR